MQLDWEKGWRWCWWCLVGLALGRGLTLDLMDVDATQYASISLEMGQNGHWLQVQHRGADYLDKPPLLFWSGAFAYALFGAYDWAYRLPSVLAALLAVYATYRFTRLLYDPPTARYAAYILGTSLGFVLFCQDVRTDTLLLGTTTTAIWLLAEFLAGNGRRYAWWGFAFVGLAMLAKGPIGLVVPAFAIGTHLLVKGRWRDFFRWEWLVGLGIVALLLSPMAWGLYQQFDLHPEKEVNGRTGVSGLYFFFWEQSFGRITGENVWRNQAPPWFFVETYLWAFLPWTLLLLGGMARMGRQAWRTRSLVEGYSWGAFFLTFIALSLSKFKLPHYIFITLPWAAVFTARFLAQAAQSRAWRRAQRVFGVLLLGMIATLPFYFFTKPSYGAIFLTILAYAGAFWHLLRAPGSEGFLLQQRWIAVVMATVLNWVFYPQLLPWQSTSQAPRIAHATGAKPDQLVFLLAHSHALDFYNGRHTRQFDDAASLQRYAEAHRPLWVYTNEAGRQLLAQQGVRYEVVRDLPHFPVTLLTGAFLHPSTRAQQAEKRWLLKIL